MMYDFIYNMTFIKIKNRLIYDIDFSLTQEQ